MMHAYRLDTHSHLANADLLLQTCKTVNEGNCLPGLCMHASLSSRRNTTMPCPSIKWLCLHINGYIWQNSCIQITGFNPDMYIITII